jgi:TolB protein
MFSSRTSLAFAFASTLLLCACAGTTRTASEATPTWPSQYQTASSGPDATTTSTPGRTNQKNATVANLPVHTFAPELGNLPNDPTRGTNLSTNYNNANAPIAATPKEDVDASAVFRPTTANAETIDATTQNVSKVTYAEEGSEFDPSLSRDGQWMLFSSTAHRATADIYIKRVESRVVTQLTNDPSHDMMPSLSPDGKQIAFASDRSGNWDIYVMPLEGGRPVQVSFDPADEISPSWSPDGTQLVYSRMGQMSGRWEMWVANTERPEVANYIGFGLFPKWCPIPATGKNGADQILYQLGRERGRRTFGVWTIDVSDGQAGNASEIRSSSKNALINPSWSPDGKWIVMADVPIEVGEYESDPFKELNGQPQLKASPENSSLWLVSVENEAPVRLTFGNRLALSPVWGRNNRLFFVSASGPAENIWSLDMTKPLAAAQALLPNRTGDAFASQPEEEETGMSEEMTVDETEGDNR